MQISEATMHAIVRTTSYRNVLHSVPQEARLMDEPVGECYQRTADIFLYIHLAHGLSDVHMFFDSLHIPLQLLIVTVSFFPFRHNLSRELFLEFHHFLMGVPSS